MHVKIHEYHPPHTVLFDGEINTLEELLALRDKHGHIAIQRANIKGEDGKPGDEPYICASTCCFFKQH